MIVKENLEIGGKAFVKTYSDSGFYIERDGEKYSEAIDPSELGRTYTETDIPIDIDPTPEPDLTVTDTLEMLNDLGVETDDKNETSTRKGIKEWINPKESQKPYNKNDKCYYKEQF